MCYGILWFILVLSKPENSETSFCQPVEPDNDCKTCQYQASIFFQFCTNAFIGFTLQNTFEQIWCKKSLVYHAIKKIKISKDEAFVDGGGDRMCQIISFTN